MYPALHTKDVFQGSYTFMLALITWPTDKLANMPKSACFFKQIPNLLLIRPAHFNCCLF